MAASEQHHTKLTQTHSRSDTPEPIPEEQSKLEKLRHKGEEVREKVKETEEDIDPKIEKLKRSR
jgi:gas vesicle protein